METHEFPLHVSVRLVVVDKRPLMLDTARHLDAYVLLFPEYSPLLWVGWVLGLQGVSIFKPCTSTVVDNGALSGFPLSCGVHELTQVPLAVFHRESPKTTF